MIFITNLINFKFNLSSVLFKQIKHKFIAIQYVYPNERAKKIVGMIWGKATTFIVFFNLKIILILWYYVLQKHILGYCIIYLIFIFLKYNKYLNILKNNNIK